MTFILYIFRCVCAHVCRSEDNLVADRSLLVSHGIQGFNSSNYLVSRTFNKTAIKIFSLLLIYYGFRCYVFMS